MDKTRSPVDVPNALFQQRRTIEEQGRELKILRSRVESLEELVLRAWEEHVRKRGARNGRSR